jgi:hypothetical protein
MTSAEELRSRVIDLFRHDADEPLRDQSFDGLARAAFAFQLEHNRPYSAYCQRRGISVHNVQHWSEIPPVPTAAFKEVDLVAGDPAAAEVTFRTSGTTHGTERRGRHHVLDLALYHAALLPNFVAHVLPDGARLHYLSLIPSARRVPDSSLSHMIDVVFQHGARGGEYFMDPIAGLQEVTLERALHGCIAQREPVCLLGTSFAFVHWLDSLAQRQQTFALPAGSRLMDTGGFKGRSRTVPADELRVAYRQRLGIPEAMCVNEYGMTELLSQFYDDTLRTSRGGTSARTARRKQPPPWVRTRAVDPETLEPVPAGEVGILQHFDLANLFSVIAVQTEDLGRVFDDGFEALGRAPGAAPRGCSIAVDVLLEAVRKSTG